MTSAAEHRQKKFHDTPKPRRVPLALFLPLPLMQPVLRLVVNRAAQTHPGLFDRLGPYGDKIFLIDPVNLPLAFLLRPSAKKPLLRACQRRGLPAYDARIAGTFLTLFALFDGRLDGDALFFTRDLVIEGDTEAVVRLRNALDDLEGRMTDDLAQSFGPVAQAGLATMRRIERRLRR